MDNQLETSSMASRNPDPETHQTYTTHHLTAPSGLSLEEFEELKQHSVDFHTYQLHSNQCSSLLAQRINAPDDVVWSIVRRFDKPQTYKHFIKSCLVSDNFVMTAGSTRDVNVISGLPAATSTERLDILDDDRQVTGFSIIGGEHRLRNYRSVTTVHGFNREGRIWTVVLESYIVDVPEGNTEEDTRLFADTVVKLNLQKLASVAEGLARDGGNKSQTREENLWREKGYVQQQLGLVLVNSGGISWKTQAFNKISQCPFLANIMGLLGLVIVTSNGSQFVKRWLSTLLGLLNIYLKIIDCQ